MGEMGRERERERGGGKSREAEGGSTCFSPLCPARSTQHMVYESTKWTSRKQVEGGIQNRLREGGWPRRPGRKGGRGGGGEGFCVMTHDL